MNSTSINKMRNAQRRFRQGRITYQKLRELYTRYAQEVVSEVNAHAHDEHEHVHGEHCNHDAPETMHPLTSKEEDALNDSWFTEEPAPIPDEEGHVCDQNCDHAASV